MSLFGRQGTRCSTDDCNHHKGVTSALFCTKSLKILYYNNTHTLDARGGEWGRV
jgi:hypothetical protein